MKLYHCEGRWQLPGQQDKHAHKVFIPETPLAMLDWLNERAVPMDVPLDGPLVESPDLGPPTHPAFTSYTHQSVQLDEDFDKLPLARQLDLAARAMENARTRL